MMADMNPEEILSLDKETYTLHFNDPEFGVQLARQVATQHGFTFTPLRKTEGSSLVFTLGSELFLKITPPFFDDSIEAEIAATKIIADQLPFPIPKIIIEGQIGTWKYIVTQAVPGLQAKEVFKTLSPENLKTFASDIGEVIKAFSKIESKGFERSFGPWETYLANRLKNKRSIHLERGNSAEWVDKICHFLDKYAPIISSLGPAKLIHADLNHEHLMLNKVNSEWRVSGVIDLADAMNAPIELEFILPMLCFFRGKADLQRHLLLCAGYEPQFKMSEYSNVMMAFALQNRFMAFHDWFAREIKNGAKSVEEVAGVVFPSN